jgi:hypothetical protein
MDSTKITLVNSKVTEFYRLTFNIKLKSDSPIQVINKGILLKEWKKSNKRFKIRKKRLWLKVVVNWHKLLRRKEM